MRSVLSLICLGVWSFPGIALQAQTRSGTIDYTGSLYGYYRLEPGETKPVLPPVDRFLKAREQQPDNLLLGMGDNFGPQFGAALQMENGTDVSDPYGCYLAPTDRKNGETRPETLYKDDNRVARAAKCDNVLNFMMRAGYRAVVPGREDFMYTSRWLRVSALLLKQASQGATEIRNPDHALYLLGANLRIASSGGGQAEPSGESKPEQPGKGQGAAPQGNKYSLKGRCPLLFADAPFGADSTPCYSAGQPETLEYLERLDRLEQGHGNNSVANALESLATQSATSKESRKPQLVSLVRDQVNIFLTAWGARGPVTSLSKHLAALPATLDSTGNGVTLLDQDVTALQGLESTCNPAPTDPDANDMCKLRDELIIRLNHLKAVLQGKRFTGASILSVCPSDAAQDSRSEDKFVLSDCAREAAIRGILRTIDKEQVNVGYTLTGDKGGPKILVIGVAGTETMSVISQNNLDLCPGSAEAGAQPDSFTSCYGVAHPGAKVTITDPVAIAAAIVRAVELRVGPLDGVVVLAQMTHTEAEVLSARVERQLRSVSIPQTVQPVDLVLGEAEEAYTTPSVTLNYDLAAGQQTSHPAPVFTPLKSYSSSSPSFPGTVYEAKVNSVQGKSYSISNSIDTSSDLPPGEQKVTIVSCFMKLVDQLKSSSSPVNAPPATSCDDATAAPVSNTQDKKAEEKDTTEGREEASRDELLLFEMLQKAVKPHSDVVLLESRDLQLDFIDPAYTRYQEVCANEQKDRQQLCRLRIALDRIFWKGDYLEFVAVKGSDLTSMIEISDKKMDDRTELIDRDITGEWLVTYGIVQSTLTNVTQVNRNDEPLWIPVDNNCKGPLPQSSVYCVGGTPLVDDQYYWLLTSDHLAQDALIYGTLEKLPPIEHETSRTFLTAPLAHYLLASLEDSKTRPEVMTVASNTCSSVECDVVSRNAYLQQMPLWQMDFLKLVANFTSRSPVGGNQFVGSYFQGVSDARASAPTQQELDLEFANRITGDLLGTFKQNPSRLSEGLQTSFGYDRSVVGNLSPSTKPINASYSLNNLTVGGFVQIRLDGKHEQGLPTSVRSLPRTLLVLTPYQYQIQINHQYLFFPFANSSPLPGELTATLPRNVSWTDRVGIRREFGSGGLQAFFATGSYLEAGGEYIIQNNVLSDITLANGTTQKTCQVNANITLQTCFGQPPQFVITSNTRLVQPVMVKDLHSPGLYWNFHLQNRLFGKGERQVNLVTDTQGDDYFGRPASAELPTQTQYAIPLSLSVVFSAFGNFSLAPTYSAFFYKSQLSTQSLQVNSFSITARWFLARDNRVPVVRQSKLPGPESSDQTKTAKH